MEKPQKPEYYKETMGGAALEENRIWMIRSEKWNKGEGVQLNRREEVKVNTEGKRGRRDK